MPQNALDSLPSRRTLVKGAAWAVPAVVLTAPAPAMAASGDPIELDVFNIITYDWANPGGKQLQTFVISDLFFTLTNVPSGVNVNRIEWGYWVDIRRNNNTATPWQNNGWPYPGAKVAGDGNSTVPSVTQDACKNSSSCGFSQVTYTGATFNAAGEVTGGTVHTYRDGRQRQGWQAKVTWTNTGANFTRNGTTITTNTMGPTNWKPLYDAGTNLTNRVEVRGAANDASWFKYTAYETGPTSRTTYNYSYQGAIAYLSNGATAIVNGNPTNEPTPWA